MLIYAHRGLSGRYPENTLLAFRHALAAGVDGIEVAEAVGKSLLGL